MLKLKPFLGRTPHATLAVILVIVCGCARSDDSETDETPPVSSDSAGVPSSPVPAAASAIAQSPVPQRQEICALLAKRAEEKAQPAVTKLPEEEEKALEYRRTCIKSYPWPDDVSFPHVSVDRMLQIRDEIDMVIREGRAATHLKPHQEKALLYIQAMGRDPRLLSLYSRFLVAFLQNKDEQFSDVITTVDDAEKTLEKVTPMASPFDSMDKHTYFSRGTLINFLFVLRTKAALATGFETPGQQLEAAYRYAEFHPSLINVAAFLDGAPPDSENPASSPFEDHVLTDLQESLKCSGDPQ